MGGLIPYTVFGFALYFAIAGFVFYRFTTVFFLKVIFADRYDGWRHPHNGNDINYSH